MFFPPKVSNHVQGTMNLLIIAEDQASLLASEIHTISNAQQIAQRQMFAPHRESRVDLLSLGNRPNLFILRHRDRYHLRSQLQVYSRTKEGAP